jgi:hypothetical protein
MRHARVEFCEVRTYSHPDCVDDGATILGTQYGTCVAIPFAAVGIHCYN